MFKSSDKLLQSLIQAEYKRQQEEIEMIASENYVSAGVMNSLANVFTNKYSEGYPWARYYGGQEVVDKLELLTQKKALRLFNLDKNIWSVNVQPLSGSPANLAVYLGVLKAWDTILGMDLSAGGHLSHGHKLNASGLYYHIVSYGLNPQTMLIDYDDILAKALEHKPKIILAGFSAYPRTLDRNTFATIADKVEKKHGYRPILMADIAHISGLIVGKQLQGPFEKFDIVTTTTHKTLRWPRGALIYCKKQYEKAINRGVFPGLQWGPHQHTLVAKCIAFDEAIKASFKQYSKKVIQNAQTLASELQNYGRPIVTGGTENHIILIDTTKKVTISIETWAKKLDLFFQETGLSWKKAEKVLETIGISVNKNMIPFDTRAALDPSGLRLGTAALTTRGLGVKEVKLLARIIDQALTFHNKKSLVLELKKEVHTLCKKFPLKY